jgi:filamentous hemagglutinin family protein
MMCPRVGSVVAALITAVSPAVVSANPLGGQVLGGSATIEGQGTPGVVVNQSSQSAIINWQSFNIAPGETTRFIQPDASSVALNRVTGDKSPSSIFGALSANGRIFLVNPEGFIFGPTARINTAAFLATTHDIRNEDFLAGRYTFNFPGNPSASIVNQGLISVADTGIAALVAPGVRNEGVIEARLGTVALASTNAFTLDLYGDKLITFAPDSITASQVVDVATGKPLKALVDNRGRLSADGGTVALSASGARAVVDSVINNSGVIEARSVGMQNGRIVLSAQTKAVSRDRGLPEQKVSVSGKLDVSGKSKGQTGGEVRITGQSISLDGVAIDASGNAGGGKILVGGDYMGGKPDPKIVTRYGIKMEDDDVPTADSVTGTASTKLDASAIEHGDGGKVVLWSDGTTDFKGHIAARGGKSQGNGGFAEVSGKYAVDYAGITVDLGAVAGHAGTILFDPQVEVIDAAKAVAISDVLNQGANVVLHTSVSPVTPDSRTMFVNADILKTAGGSAELAFFAGQGIEIAPDVTIGSSSGALNVLFWVHGNAIDYDPVSGYPSAATFGKVNFGAGSMVYTNSGTVYEWPTAAGLKDTLESFGSAQALNDAADALIAQYDADDLANNFRTAWDIHYLYGPDPISGTHTLVSRQIVAKPLASRAVSTLSLPMIPVVQRVFPLLDIWHNLVEIGIRSNYGISNTATVKTQDSVGPTPRLGVPAQRQTRSEYEEKIQRKLDADIEHIQSLKFVADGLNGILKVAPAIFLSLNRTVQEVGKAITEVAQDISEFVSGLFMDPTVLVPKRIQEKRTITDPNSPAAQAEYLKQKEAIHGIGRHILDTKTVKGVD